MIASRRLPGKGEGVPTALLEAMALGMPVVVLDTTEAAEAVPDGVGVRSTDPARLRAGLRELVADPAAAAAAGGRAREAVLRRYGLARFLADWDALMDEVAPVRRTTPVAARR